MYTSLFDFFIFFFIISVFFRFSFWMVFILCCGSILFKKFSWNTIFLATILLNSQQKKNPIYIPVKFLLFIEMYNFIIIHVLWIICLFYFIRWKLGMVLLQISWFYLLCPYILIFINIEDEFIIWLNLKFSSEDSSFVLIESYWSINFEFRFLIKCWNHQSITQQLFLVFKFNKK